MWNIIYNFKQWSDDWFEVRKLKMTASHAIAIWNCWKWLNTYIGCLVSEYFSKWVKDSFYSKDMERGNELEQYARSIYELENDIVVEEVWFIEYDKYVWCSPDWLVWKDGWIEIKCHNDEKHFNLIINWEKEIESWYIWQIQMNLLITGRKWWDFISYNPNFEKSLVVYRIYPDEDKFKKLKEWFNIWEQKIEDLIKKYNNSFKK